MTRFFAGLFILAFIGLSSCVTRERCAKFYPPAVTKIDSVRVTVTERVHDTTIVILQDSSYLKAWIECDSSGQAILRELIGYQSGNRAMVPQVVLKNNVLTAACKCDSMVIHHLMKTRDTVRERISETLTIPPPVHIRYIPGWMWFFGISGMVLWGIGLLYLGYRILKLKRILTI